MLHKIEGGFGVYREVAEWCITNGIEIVFVVRMLDRSLEGDESYGGIYIRYISAEDAAEGVIQHTINEFKQTRIIGPTLIDVTSDLELFYLRYKGIHGIIEYVGD